MAKPSLASGAFTPRTVALADEFGSTNALVVKPVSFCVPADKNGEGVVDPAFRYVCYKVKRVPGAPAIGGGGVDVEDQFGALSLEVRRRRHLCVPAVDASMVLTAETIPYPDPSDARPVLAERGSDFLIGDPNANGESGVVHLVDGVTGALLRTFPNPTPHYDDYFGSSVAAVGSSILVGAPIYDESGEVYLIDGATGALQLTIPNPDPVNGIMGHVVAAFGTDLLVSGGEAGHVGTVFLFDGSTGALVRTFASPAPEPGDRFGQALAVRGSDILIGASFQRNSSGNAYLFDGTTGALLRTFKNPDPGGDDAVFGLDFFGRSVAFAGDDVLVGAPGENNTGVVYLFDGGTGGLLRTFNNPTPAPRDLFGSAVNVLGSTLFVGVGEDGTAGSRAGAVYSFDLTTGEHLATFVNPSPATSRFFALPLRTTAPSVILAAATGAAYVLPAASPCGDGALDAGEECDDGNADYGDGCAPGCRLEPLQHVTCYRAKASSAFAPHDTVLSGAFDSGEVAARKPDLYCAAANKNDEGFADESAVLTCYKSKDASRGRRPRRREVDVGDQFGDLRLRLSKPKALCVPGSPSGAFLDASADLWGN